MLSQKVKGIKSKWSFVKNLDIYAKPITMTYRGKEKFRSKFGGFISLAILVFIILIFSYKLRVMVQRTNS
jgi:hypothetical protein